MRAGALATLVTLAVPLLLIPIGCGKYGRPVRASEKQAAGPAGAVSDPHPADCEDPEHDHE